MKQQARKLLRQLCTEEMRERVHLSEGHLQVLQAIGLGRPVKGAKLALDAISLMLTYSQPKPAQQLDVRQATYQISDPYAAQALPAPEPRLLVEQKAADWEAEHELRLLEAAPRPEPLAPGQLAKEENAK